MVSIRFLNLLRSKYSIDRISLDVHTIKELFDVLLTQYPLIDSSDLNSAIVFINGKKVSHLKRHEVILHPNDDVAITHFVGGG